MKSSVLVTGHGGFLGKAVCRWLLERGYRVRGFARNRYLLPELSEVEQYEGDLRDLNAVRKGCQGIDVVIHTAALAGVWGAKELYESINLRGTENLLIAAQSTGVGGLVYSSSPSVTFDGKPQSGIDERAPYPTRWYCHYPRTKALAEQAVLRSNAPGSFHTCSLRPHLIWGAGDPHLFPRVIDRCRQKKLRRVGHGINRIDVTHVDSAAESHGLAMEKLLAGDSPVAGKSYFISDGDPIGCWEWIGEILKTASLKPPSRSIPFSIAYALGGCLEFFYAALRKKEEPPMTRFVALQLGVDHYFSIEAARRDLGFHPRVDRQRILQDLFLASRQL